METQPKTLQEAIVYFADPDNCLNYVKAWRWSDGIVVCPTCKSTKITFLANQRKWQCGSHHAKRQFSVKVGTVMEDSPLGLDKWLVAMWLVANCKNAISSCEIERALGITQKSAWHLMHRIRLTMQDDVFGTKLSGEVEADADESFIGGKARNMHVSERKRRITGTGTKDKTAVMGIMERGGKVRATVVPNRRKNTLQAEVRKHVEAGAALYTERCFRMKDWRVTTRIKS
jgi:transposase-like protein